MKKALLISPCSAAILFTIPEAWQFIQQPDSNYIPVVFEVLILIFGYIAALLFNAVIVIPLCLLVRLRSSSMIAGVILAFFISLISTTIAYAFEVFDYQTSILHPSYLYPLLIPLFVMPVTTFFFLTRMQTATAVPQKPHQEKDPSTGKSDELS